MKILVIGFAKIKYMPYLNFYTDNLDKIRNDVHLLYWNRDLKEEDTSSLENITLHEFKFYQEDEVSKLLKLKAFSKFRKNALNLLKTERFDFVIFMHSLSGVLINDYLIKNYKGRYIFDYRDSTFEGFAPFKKIIHRLVKNSYATFVSSDAFRKLLPPCENIYTSHNLLEDSLEHRNEKELYGIKSDKIRMSFWGFIRHEDINREMIRKIAADDRFELHYYGREQQTALNLKKFKEEIGAKNVFFHGEYVPEDRYEFVRNTDLIHNVYFDKNMMMAMGNKYYDGIIFKIPLVCMKDSFMAKRAENAGVGKGFDPYDDDFAEKVFKYYNSVNLPEFCKKCDAEFEKIMKEFNNGRAVIKGLK